MFDDTGNDGERDGELCRIGDAAEGAIINVVAAIGDECCAILLAQHRRDVALQRFGGFGDASRCGGMAVLHDFYGQRKLPQRLHQLGLIGDDDHLFRGGGHDLLDQMRAAAALDEIEIAIGFIGAIDHQIEIAHLVELGNRNAQRARLFRRAVGGGDAGDGEPATHARGQNFEEGLGR